MKKRALLLLLAFVMVLTACGGVTSSTMSSSDAVSVETSSTESVDAPSDTASVETPSGASIETPSVTSEVSTDSSAPESTATPSTESSATTTSSTASSQTSSATSSKPVMEGGYKIGSNPTCGLPISVTIVREMYFGDSMYQLDEKELWMKKISERYGVKLNVECLTKSDVSTIYNARLAAGTLLGLVGAYSKEQWVGWMKDGAILPIDEYLKDNATWKMLPTAMKEVGVYGGQTWALNIGLSGFGNGTIWARSIRADWVKAVGLPDIGTSITTSQYTDILQAFADNADSLMPGLVPVQFRNSTFTYLDIFGAFDAVIMNESAYSYNPESQAMEDVFLKPGALDAIAYIRNIYSNGWCPKTAFDTGSFADMRTFLASGKVGSFSMYRARYSSGGTTVEALVKAAYNITKLDWDKLGDGYSEFKKWNEQTWSDTLLTGTRTKNVEVFSNSGGGGLSCLMKGTPQPKETINYIVDLYFASNDNFIEARQGLLDTMVVKDADNMLMIKWKDKAAGLHWSDMGGSAFVNYVNPNPYPTGDYIFYKEDSKGPALKRIQIVNAYNTGLDAAALAQGLVYTTKQEYFSPQINSKQWVNYSGEANAAWLAFIIDGFTKTNITIDRCLEQYKSSMRAINGDLMLKQMNDAYGMVNDYQSYK